MALSIGLGFVMGWVLCKLVSILFAAANRRRANVFFKYAQIASAAAMSFMHGAQDGQKFIGVLFLGVAFASGQTSVGDAGIPIWIMLLCSATMGIGTSVGGERIIKSVGQSMVKLEKYQGFSADLSAAFCLLLSSSDRTSSKSRTGVSFIFLFTIYISDNLSESAAVLCCP